MALSASWQSPAASPSPPLERQRRRRAFHAARRHSRLVRRLRVLLPFAGAAVIAVFFGATKFSASEDPDLSAARLSVTSNSIVMQSPHMTGFDKSEREFTVIADRAVQAIGKPNVIALENIVATMAKAGGAPTTIKAEAGDYDRTGQTLKLHGKIAVDSSEGYSVRMTDADVDFTAGTLASSNPVSVTFGDDTTTAQSVSVAKGGEIITFQGGVRTVLVSEKNSAGGNPPGQEQARR